MKKFIKKQLYKLGWRVLSFLLGYDESWHRYIQRYDGPTLQDKLNDHMLAISKLGDELNIDPWDD